MQSVQAMRKIVYIGLFSALFIVLGLIQIKISASAVPISLQTLGITLAAIFLKPRHAFLSILICILIGMVGIPIFGGKGGIPHLLGPTGGFIVYFAFGALIISFLIHKLIDKKLNLLHYIAFFIVFYLFGALASYIIGIPWFMVVTDNDLAKSISIAFVPFVIGDLLKSLVAVLIIPPLHRYIKKTRQSLPL